MLAPNRESWDESEDMEGDQKMIGAFKDAVFGATAHAPRFKVGAGECLILDNYRALHIREPYLDLERRGWRREVYVESKCAGKHVRTEDSVQNELLSTVETNLALAAAAEALDLSAFDMVYNAIQLVFVSQMELAPDLSHPQTRQLRQPTHAGPGIGLSSPHLNRRLRLTVAHKSPQHNSGTVALEPRHLMH